MRKANPVEKNPEDPRKKTPTVSYRLSALKKHIKGKESSTDNMSIPKKRSQLKETIKQSSNLSPEMPADMRNTIVETLEKVDDFVTENYKSDLKQADTIKAIVIQQMQNPFIQLANKYLEQVQAASGDVYKIADIKNKFHAEIKEKMSAMEQLVQKYKKEKGWIDGEVLAKLSKSARKLKKLLNSKIAREIKDLIQYAIIGDTEALTREDFISQTTELFKKEFPSGENIDFLWYILYETNSESKIAVGAQIYEHLKKKDLAQAEEFLKKGNSRGSFTLAQMEEIRGEKYENTKRKEYNDQYKAARDVSKIVQTMAAPYGTYNIWDSIDSGTIGKLLLQVGAGITIGSNLVINKGRPNEYVAGAAAILVGAHIMRGEKPLGLSEKDTRDETLNIFKELQSDTLVWEEWDHMFTNEQTGENNIKNMRKYAQYVKNEHGEIPKNLNKEEFNKFLNLEGMESFKKSYKSMSDSAKNPDTFIKYLKVFSEISTGDQVKSKGIYDSNSYERAINIMRTR